MVTILVQQKLNSAWCAHRTYKRLGSPSYFPHTNPRRADVTTLLLQLSPEGLKDLLNISQPMKGACLVNMLWLAAVTSQLLRPAETGQLSVF